jgi:hypothetical protein
MDSFDNKGNLRETVFRYSNESLMKGWGIEIGTRFELLGRRREGRIPHFRVKALESFVFEKVKNPATAVAAKSVFPIMDHHFITEL